MARFVGTVSVTWLEHPGDDRDMKLNLSFTFEDDTGLKWTAARGAVINGASIPRIFWTTFGSPFIGDYRRASIVHDHFCDVRTRTAAATHRMFYEACRAGGVSEIKAKTMYTMVKTFGPSWTVAVNGLSINGTSVVAGGDTITFSHTMGDDEFTRLTRWIEEQNPGIDAIDAEIRRRASEVIVLPPPPPPGAMGMHVTIEQLTQ